MGFGQRLREIAAAMKGADPRRVESQLTLAGIFHPSNRPEPDSIALGQIDGSNPAIYALIQRLVEDITTPPLQLVRETGPDAFDIVDDHEALIPVLRAPNEHEIPRAFWQQIFADLIWLGDGYIWTNSPDGITPPNQFLRLHPSQVTPTPPEPPNGKVLAFYRWRNDRRQQDYDPKIILHFRTRNPDGPYRGKGIGVRLRDWLNLERQAMDWQYRRYVNDIPVDLILKTTQKMSDPEVRKRAEEFLDNRLTGRKNGGRKWMMLDDATWDVEALPRAMEKDLQHLETLKFIRATYAMTCGVSPSKLADYSDSFRANAEQQCRDYWEDQIMVWHALIVDTLNAHYLRRFWPEDKGLRFQYDYTKIRALASSEAEITTLVKDRVATGLITINEGREAMGLDEFPDPVAEELLWNGKPLGQAPEPALPGGPNSLDTQDPADAGDTAEPAAKPGEPKQPKKILELKAAEDDRPASQGGIHDPRQIFNTQAERERLKSLVKKDIQAMVRAAGERQLDLAGIPAAFNAADPAVLSFVIKQTIGLVDAVTATTEDLVRRAIAESIQGGKSVADMRSALQEAYTVRRQDWQLDRVARTETHTAQEGGGHLAAEQAGLEAKRWITSRDDRVRGLDPKEQADHAEMEGQVVPMGAPFTDPRSGARLQFPGDRDGAKSGADTINCRCTWIADFSHLKSMDVEYADLEQAWETKSADRQRWELGLKRRLKSHLFAQERRVLEAFDAITREHHARRTGTA